MARSVFAPFLVACLALLVLFGCGGGSTGGGSSSSSTNGGTSTQILLTLVGTADASTTAPAQSLANIVQGQTLNVRALRVVRQVSSSGSVTYPGAYVDVANLQITSPSNVASVSGNTIVANANSASSYTVQATVNGQNLSTVLRVLPSGLVRVTGSVRTSTGANAAGSTVSFYAAGSTEALATVSAGASGDYVAYVPSDAARFSVDATSVKSNGLPLYYNTYSFGSLNYDATLDCTAPLPTLGSSTTVGSLTLYYKNGSIPGAPTGCVGG